MYMYFWFTVITLVAEDSFTGGIRMSERHISVPKPFATGDVSEWFTRYEICSTANGWNDEQKALKLPTLLEGEALALWFELAEEEQKDYKTTKEKLVMKMKPPGFISLTKDEAWRVTVIVCTQLEKAVNTCQV